ncbi:hypothetical protein [Tortoise microvirus 39]|nr:hypothetical protein [Tortoise microvirus 39]
MEGNMSKSNKERQAQYRAKLESLGQTNVTGIVNYTQVGDVLILLRRLRDNPDLEVGLIRNTRTGRYEKL